MNFIICIMLIVACGIFYGNIIPMLIQNYEHTKMFLMNRWTLLFCGLCSFIMMVLGLLMVFMGNPQNNVKPTYEPVGEQLYRRTK